MNKQLRTDPVVNIEWSGQGGNSIALLKQEDLFALARALGRLAARRDLARLSANQITQDMISTASGAKVKASA